MAAGWGCDRHDLLRVAVFIATSAAKQRWQTEQGWPTGLHDSGTPARVSPPARHCERARVQRSRRKGQARDRSVVCRTAKSGAARNGTAAIVHSRRWTGQDAGRAQTPVNARLRGRYRRWAANSLPASPDGCGDEKRRAPVGRRAACLAVSGGLSRSAPGSRYNRERRRRRTSPGPAGSAARRFAGARPGPGWRYSCGRRRRRRYSPGGSGFPLFRGIGASAYDHARVALAQRLAEALVSTGPPAQSGSEMCRKASLRLASSSAR